MYLEQQLGELSELLAACKETSLAAAQEAVRLTAQAIGAKKKLFLCGNGGSAATASHIANDLSMPYEKLAAGRLSHRLPQRQSGGADLHDQRLRL